MKKSIGLCMVLLIYFSIIFSNIVIAYADNYVPNLLPVSDWSSQDTIAMSNYMNGIPYCIKDKWVFRRAWADRQPLLSINTLAEESSVIGFDRPAYIYSDGMWVIYLKRDDSNRTSIVKVRITGGGETILVDASKQPIAGTIRYLQIYNNQLYFSINNEGSVFSVYYSLNDKNVNTITGGYYKADLDGSNITQIFDKPIFDPYFIGDKLYYQDYNDGKKLHVCDPDGMNDQIFIDDVCYQYIFDGEKYYYISYDGKVEWDEKGFPLNASDLHRVLKCYSPSSGTEVFADVTPSVFAYNGAKIVYSNYYDSDRLYSFDVNTKRTEALYFEDFLWSLCFIDQNRIYCVNSDAQNQVETTSIVKIDGTGMTVLDEG